MNKEEILKWNERYDKEEDLYNKGTEEEIGNNLRKTGFLTKEDLIKIIQWKFQGRLLGRQKRVLNLLQNLAEEKICFNTSKVKADSITVKLLISSSTNRRSEVFLSKSAQKRGS